MLRVLFDTAIAVAVLGIYALGISYAAAMFYLSLWHWSV